MRMRLEPFAVVCVLAGSLIVASEVASAAPVSTVAAVIESEGASWGPALSDDGRYLSFVSEAADLINGDPSADPNGVADVFWVDTLEGTIRLISCGVGGGPANGPSSAVDLSADGRYVAFESTATNLMAEDANGAVSDVFVYDVLDGSLELVSRRGATGAQGNADSFAPSISADGRKVAFASDATNLVGNDTNLKADVFIRALDTATTTRVSTSSSGSQAKNVTFDPVISPDGGWVAFSSLATNLVSGDTNGARDVFLKNLSTAKTIRVSIRSDGTQAAGSSSVDDVSANGKQVVFYSSAPNLIKSDTNNRGDVFLRDRLASTTIRVSRYGSTEPNGESFGSSISADGGTIVFQSWATNLGDGEDTNGAASDLFEYGVATKVTSRISVNVEGGWPNDASYDARIAGGGGTIGFTSLASDIVPGDGNGAADVFVRRRLDVGASVARWSVGLPPAGAA